MKKIALVLLFVLCAAATSTFAQEKYGKTLNLGVGLGYYGYIGHTLPVLHVNYEFDVAKNFTLAPFVSFYTYTNRYYWGNSKYPFKHYTYRETVIPIGVKGTYYFDKFLEASSDWDFYAAGSLGFAIVSRRWDNDYYGDRDYFRGASPLYLDVHVGAQYNVNNKVGIFLDLSSGVSTLGLALRGLK